MYLVKVSQFWEECAGASGVVQEVIVHVAVFIDDPVVMAAWRQMVGDRLNMVRLTIIKRSCLKFIACR